MRSLVALAMLCAGATFSGQTAWADDPLLKAPARVQQGEYHFRGKSFVEMVRTAIDLARLDTQRSFNARLAERKRRGLNQGPISAMVRVRDNQGLHADTRIRFERESTGASDDVALREMVPKSARPLCKAGLARARRYLATLDAESRAAGELEGLEVMFGQTREKILSGNNWKIGVGMFFVFKDLSGAISTSAAVALSSDSARKLLFEDVYLERDPGAEDPLHDGWDGILFPWNVSGGW